MSTSTTTILQMDDSSSSIGSSTWRIPRPSIHGSSTSASSTSSSSLVVSHTQPMSALLVPALTQYQRNLSLTTQPNTDKQFKDDTKWNPRHSTSSSSLTEGSESMLLSASRLPKEQDPDNVSIASSMHFTIVNGMGTSRSSQSCCRGRYQLSILVITMTVVLFLAILAAILFIQVRARYLRHT